MFVAGKIIHTARSFGLDFNELNVTLARHGDLGVIKSKSDLIVFVSKSGETVETVGLAKYLRDLGYTNTLCISSCENSKLSKFCNSVLVIPVDDEGSPLGVGAPMISSVVYMVVLHGILSEVISNSDVSTVELFKKNHPGGLIGKRLGAGK